jgi:hypothetical protein
MSRLFKFLFVLWAIAGVGGLVQAFSLLGPNGASNPNATWQVGTIGYNTRGDIGGPVNIGEEFRWNTPFITYSYDSSFLNYFGTEGVAAIEEAIAILNALPPASQMDLNSFPLYSWGLDSTANALQLQDLKSTALCFLLEEMGLAQSERYVWTLRARVTHPGITNYSVISRNFDAFTWEPSNLINGIHYTYNDIIDAQPPPPGAFPLVLPVEDPLDFRVFSTVANPFNLIQTGGRFYSGLTQDDAAALRYLFRPDNYNVEVLLPDIRVVATNQLLDLLFTEDLTSFNEFVATNDPVQLSNARPDLIILSSNRFFTNAITTNFVFYLTNFPWSPAGSLTLTQQAVMTTNIATNWVYTFANIVTNAYYTQNVMQVQQTIITNYPFDPAGTPGVFTNITTYVVSNYVGGTMYVVPPGLSGYDIIDIFDARSGFITNTIAIANFNGGGTSNLVQTNLLSFIRPFTNFVYDVHRIELRDPTNAIGLRPGVDKVTFIRMGNDSLLGTIVWPITNTYVDTVIVSNTTFTQLVRRINTRPDIVFLAEDLGFTANAGPVILSRTTADSWNSNFNLNGQAGLAGPGVITPQITISFTTTQPYNLNFFAGQFFSFLQQPYLGQLFQNNPFDPLTFAWGSFNGSTNVIVYPHGSSIMSLENQILNP